MKGVVVGVLVLSLHSLLSVEAFVSRSSPTTTLIVQKNQREQYQKLTTNSKLFSQWNDEDSDDDAADVKISPTYEEAGKAIGVEDDKASMDDIGDFDASPGYVASDIDRYREAIKKRADSLGIDKLSLAEKEEFERKARESALSAKENNGSAGAGASSSAAAAADTGGAGAGGDKLSQMLDLTQITTDAPRGPNEDMPAFMYNPADDMTDEEMIEADPTGQLPIFEQFKLTLGKAKYPPASDLVVEVIILVITIVVTATVIYTWDNWMRELAFYFSMVPRPEETLQNMDGMVLPDDPGPLVGSEMLKQLQDGAKQTFNAVQDGSLIDQLQQSSPSGIGGGPGDIPQDL